MWRGLLFAIGAIYALTAFYVFFMPNAFYADTPGVAMMGPFNLHFIRDAGLAYFASGAALLWGAYKRDKSAAIFGALWPCLHAAFHIWIWAGRGVPFDSVAATNLFGIQGPAWLALIAAWRFRVS